MAGPTLAKASTNKAGERVYVYESQPPPEPKAAPVQRSVAPRPSPPPVVSSGGGGVNKALILTEMVILFGGTVAVHRSRGESWVDIWTKTALRSAMATILILAILLTIDDLGGGSTAALFGGLIVIGYLLTAFGYLGPALLNLEQAALGAPVNTNIFPAPTSLEGPSSQKAKSPS